MTARTATYAAWSSPTPRSVLLRASSIRTSDGARVPSSAQHIYPVWYLFSWITTFCLLQPMPVRLVRGSLLRGVLCLQCQAVRTEPPDFRWQSSHRREPLGCGIAKKWLSQLGVRGGGGEEEEEGVAAEDADARADSAPDADKSVAHQQPSSSSSRKTRMTAEAPTAALFGDYPLHDAASAGATAYAVSLVRTCGLDVDGLGPPGGYTPLMLAARRGHAAMLLALINELGARVGAVDAEGNSALHHAASAGHTDCVLVLLTANAARVVKSSGSSSPNSGGTLPPALFLDAASLMCGWSALHIACLYARAHTVAALLGWGASMQLRDATVCAADGKGATAQQLIGASRVFSRRAKAQAATRRAAGGGGGNENEYEGADAAEEEEEEEVDDVVWDASVAATVAVFVWFKQLAVLGKEVLAAASWGWDEPRMKSAIKAFRACVARKPRCSDAGRATGAWAVARKPIDYFREAGTGRTPLLVACAAKGNPAGPCFRNIEALIHANSSVLVLGADGRDARQLVMSRGSYLVGKWFEPMWPMWYGGHNPSGAYHRAANHFLNCCRWSRGRTGMHPDDWCIPRHDAYRILTFLGPELAGMWPGPPRGYKGYIVPRAAWARAAAAAAAWGAGPSV